MNCGNPGWKKYAVDSPCSDPWKWSVDGLSWIDMVDPELLFAKAEFPFVVVI